MRSSAAGSPGKAGGKIVLPSMMPALPNEVCSPIAGALDQRHAHAALGEMQRDRGADDAGAEHNGVRASHPSCSCSSLQYEQQKVSAIDMARIEHWRYDLIRSAGDRGAMPILTGLTAALAWLGRQGTRALAASVFLGLALPQLAAYVKPYLAEAVFVLLLFSYLRTDPAAFLRYLRSPVLTIMAALWVMVVVPLLFGLGYTLVGLREGMPALYTILILQIATTPITSSAAFAALMGLDVAFSLVTLIITNAMSPITTVAFSYFFLGSSLFSPIDLGIKLFLFFAASAAIAYVIRRIAGQAWLERQKEPIDGLNVIAVFVFAIAAMESVPRNVVADPVFALELFVLVIVVSCALIGVSVLVFARSGLDRAVPIGLLAAFRNIGLVMAALGSQLPDLAWFYFAMAQFPIYLLPALLQPLARRLQRPGSR